MDKNKGKKIGVAGNHTTTIDLISNLLHHGYKIDCIINIASSLDGKVAGYTDLGSFAKKNRIKIIRPKTYGLKSEYDKKAIGDLKLDVLLVCGWQRLVPEWLLSTLTIGAFGTHGSWKPLPYGRERSPGNWSLLLGKDTFIDNLFKYDSGIDSGAIVGSIQFKLSPFDTIATYYHKDQLVQQTLLLKHLPALLSGTFNYRMQPTAKKAFLLPKRTEEDGVIDWNWKTEYIFNLVRAVTRPYPGAYTFLKSKKITIWNAIPFHLFRSFKTKRVGEIIAAFDDSTFVVRTNDGALQVLEYEATNWRPKAQQVLHSTKNKSFVKLRLAGIYER
ncbi:hypothetical protein A3C28_01180 [Candidatus Roizmanbacteria bacterium RIFCSPHIGHO2_02_FULL_39_9]|uniref:Formyl transferase C-terminal domain-containing protein n=2 Tax=Candidatus Roizmaniibacteriota TaxID=1752723 RepID=A0A1F7H9S6_9BACT|nr:MAG: hypothetical protein A3C28_01180 [Candidatus Roizmanbacteria bacterium RIFCSPHIGHO2_02_FULL_39_9]